jgi:hypothetical protein
MGQACSTSDRKKKLQRGVRHSQSHSEFHSHPHAQLQPPPYTDESYLNFLKKSDREKYKGRRKIPIDTFQTLYFNGDVEFRGNGLEVLEYRHDWASFHFTLSIFKFFLFNFIPEVILHTRSQGRLCASFFQPN